MRPASPAAPRNVRCVCAASHTIIRLDWLLDRSHWAAGTLQIPRWLQFMGCLQAAGDLLTMLATSSQPCRRQISSLRPPTSPPRLRVLRKPLQQISLWLTQTNPGMREDRRSCTMPSTRASLCAAPSPKYNDQVYMQHACTSCAPDMARSAHMVKHLST